MKEFNGVAEHRASGIVYRQQGMNEIIAPIYYCYSLDKTCKLEDIEADTYWSFSALMDDIKGYFTNINDKEKGGICDKVVLFE